MLHRVRGHATHSITPVAGIPKYLPPTWKFHRRQLWAVSESSAIRKLPRLTSGWSAQMHGDVIFVGGPGPSLTAEPSCLKLPRRPFHPSLAHV